MEPRLLNGLLGAVVKHAGLGPGEPVEGGTLGLEAHGQTAVGADLRHDAVFAGESFSRQSASHDFAALLNGGCGGVGQDVQAAGRSVEVAVFVIDAHFRAKFVPSGLEVRVGIRDAGVAELVGRTGPELEARHLEDGFVHVVGHEREVAVSVGRSLGELPAVGVVAVVVVNKLGMQSCRRVVESHFVLVGIGLAEVVETEVVALEPTGRAHSEFHVQRLWTDEEGQFVFGERALVLGNELEAVGVGKEFDGRVDVQIGVAGGKGHEAVFACGQSCDRLFDKLVGGDKGVVVGRIPGVEQPLAVASGGFIDFVGVFASTDLGAADGRDDPSVGRASFKRGVLQAVGHVLACRFGLCPGDGRAGHQHGGNERQDFLRVQHR